jgi:hypothetical protein
MVLEAGKYKGVVLASVLLSCGIFLPYHQMADGRWASMRKREEGG